MRVKVSFSGAEVAKHVIEYYEQIAINGINDQVQYIIAHNESVIYGDPYIKTRQQEPRH